MKCRALACDYDGTLAHDGVVSPSTAAAVERFRASGAICLWLPAASYRS
jgi:hydroxymethylpyrimidine pyrophosphatase-like HAD family hydrolase